MSFDGQKLFNLMPALYRLRDEQIAQNMTLLSPAETALLQNLQNLPAPLTPAQQAQLDDLTSKSTRGPLQSLLMLLGEQVGAVEEDLDQLYDDQFIETCAPWVIPYIGALIGYQPINGIAESVANPRSEVAHTVSYRRRKGTIAMLEQLARDVTGWGAHAVEFFKILGDTQYLKHLRLQNLYSPDVRRWEPLLYVDSAFDRLSHTVEVRRVAEERGRTNIQNLGIFLWRLNPYLQKNSPAVKVDNQRYRFSPLGSDLPLFYKPLSQGTEILTTALPVNVPGRLERRVLCQDIKKNQGQATVYYGNSLALYVNGASTPVAASQIWVCDLSGDDTAGWANMPAAGTDYFAVDPELGRIVLPAQPTAPVTSLEVDFYYGFNGDMGGGSYPRIDSFSASAEQMVLQVPTAAYPTIQSALNALGGDGVVEVIDGGRYSETPSVQVKAGGHIELRSADETRATLVLNGELTVSGGAGSRFDLNGFLVTSSAAPATPAPAALVHVVPSTSANPNQLDYLGVTHCTLVPGWSLTPQGQPQHGSSPALIAEPNGLQVVVQKSILGGVRAPQVVPVSLSDSLLDATDKTGAAYCALDGLSGGGPLSMSGCTVVGKVHAGLLSLVTDSIFWSALSPADLTGPAASRWAAPLWADRKQEGCVRFSYLPDGSVIPRSFECEPPTGKGVFPGPRFTSLRYGDPGYGQMAAFTDDSIRRGADDGGEMGAFHFLQAPQRETDLRVRLQEFVPVGLEFGIFYET